MPKRKAAYAAWNYLTTFKDETKSKKMCLTYWMNRLQSFLDPVKYGDVFVTMNPHIEPNPELVIKTIEYDHPVYSIQVSFS